VTKPKRRETKKSRRVVSFAKENHLITANKTNDQVPFDSLEIARKSSNEEDEDCESVSLSRYFKIR